MTPLSMHAVLRAILAANLLVFLIGVLRVAFFSSAETQNIGEGRPDLHVTCDVRSSTGKEGDIGERRDREDVGPLKDEVDDRSGWPFQNVSVAQSSRFLVPNIVHYIWYNTEPRPLQFHHMLSVLSAHKLLNPDVIYFHTNMEPNGLYWERVRGLPNFKVNIRQPPTKLFGEKVKEPFYYTSHSNVDRIKVLLEYGGIYLDFDVVVTRPFDDLRRYPCAIGREQETKACGNVIICSRNSPFLLLWINAYLDDYQIEEWAYNSGQVPFNLARRFPHIVHVDQHRINRPNFMELEQIWGDQRFDWQNNYAVHLWYRLWKDQSPYFKGIEPNDENVKTWNSTFGEIARTILYGRKAMFHSDNPVVT